MIDVRPQFPALERTVDGEPVAYFDAPGGTQVPRGVATVMTDYLFHHNANTHWAYPSSEETDAIIAAARVAVADLLNASPKEIAFGANMSTLTFHLARALGRTWQRGDEVIVTDLDHHANVAPWRALERDFGVVTRSARFIRETMELDWEHLQSLVTPRTRLLAIGGASNAVGTVNDLERASRVARAAGALLFVDAVHLAPHELIDVRRIGCDFLACSSYKFYGPHAGILFGRYELLADLPFPKLAPAPDTAPERVETGTQSHEAIAGIAATVDFLASIGSSDAMQARRHRLAASFARIHEEGRRFVKLMWDGLSAVDGVTIYGPPPSAARTPTLGFTIEGIPSENVARELAKRAIFASHGDFYAMTVVEQLGLTDGLVRAGCACYTTENELNRLVAAVEEISARALQSV